MATICGTSLHLCFVRLTRLNLDGSVAAGPNNHVVSDNPVVLTAAPNILAGEQKDLVGGCDCVCATYRGYDKLRYWDLTLQLCALEPAMLELALGATLQVDSQASPLGIDWPSQVTCSSPKQPPVAIEGWTDLWVGDQQNQTGPQFIRWVWPMTFWQMDQFQLQNDFLTPQLKGFSRTNGNFGDPYDDLPSGVAASDTGGFFYDDAVPTGICGYSSYST